MRLSRANMELYFWDTMGPLKSTQSYCFCFKGNIIYACDPLFFKKRVSSSTSLSAKCFRKRCNKSYQRIRRQRYFRKCRQWSIGARLCWCRTRRFPENMTSELRMLKRPSGFRWFRKWVLRQCWRRNGERFPELRISPGVLLPSNPFLMWDPDRQTYTMCFLTTYFPTLAPAVYDMFLDRHW